MLGRRAFIGGLSALLAAPAIVRAELLMPIKVQLLPVATPEDFGAIGDGITDDTAAVLRAMRRAQTVIGGGGAYRITNTLVWPRGLRQLSDMMLRGDFNHGPMLQVGPGLSNLRILNNYFAHDPHRAGDYTGILFDLAVDYTGVRV